MLPPFSWTEETQVKTYETDVWQRWKPACFFQAMQQAATNHADHLGFPYELMLSRKQIWILSRMKISFLAFPKMGERINVTTWPRGVQQKIFFIRDFIFASPEGDRYAVATSAWVLINPELRRLLPPRALLGEVPDNGDVSALDEILERIVLPQQMEHCLSIKAGYSAIDLMGHVNNARYIDWICDCFPVEQHQNGTIESIQINYINEVKPSDTVQIAAAQSADDPCLWLIRGKNQSSQAIAFEASLTWK